MAPENSTLPGRPAQLAESAAGLLALLCIKAHESAQRLKLSRVHFCTREGIFFRKFFEKFATGPGWEERAELLHVSRLATFAASLATEGCAGLDRFFRQYPDADWNELVSSLGAGSPPPSLGPLIRRCGGLRGQTLLSAVLAVPDLRRWVADVAAERHARLMTYLQLRHPDIVDGSDVAIVDIGWRGSIQDNLALALPAIRWHGLYLGLLPAVARAPDNASKYAVLFQPGDGNHVDAANVLPLEYLFHAPIGSILGYDGGSPQFATALEEPLGSYAAEFQEALLARASSHGTRYADASSPESRTGLEQQWRHDAYRFWASTQAMPDSLFDAICLFRHDETFGISRIVQISDAASWGALLRSLTDYRTRRLLIQHGLAIPESRRRFPAVGWWLHAAQGVLTLADRAGRVIGARK